MHASRALDAIEQNYSQIEKEELALVYAVKKFHKMTFGQYFTLCTDHQPLLKIFGNKNGIPIHNAKRFQRWSILDYNFKIQ